RLGGHVRSGPGERGPGPDRPGRRRGPRHGNARGLLMARPRLRAAPSAGALLRDVTREAREGWPPGMTLFTGDDLFHLDRAQRALLDALAPRQGSDMALTVYADQRVD